MTDASFSVDGSLARSTVSLNDAAAAVGGGEAADFTGASGATLGWLVARAAEKARVLAIVPDTNAARLLAEDVRAFLGERADELPPLVYPASEITPFVEIAPERRTQMDRLGVLDHLAEGRPFSVLVVPVAALLRRVPPPSSLAGRSLRVEVATSLDREAFLATLVRAGYTRTPVAEDPGTFAVRGSIIDVFPPRDPNPARIELDDDTVTAIKRFDPVEQRSLDAVDDVLIHPVREIPTDAEAKRNALTRIRALCDDVNLPTTKTNQLLAELEEDRVVFGADGFTPAYFDGLEPLWAYLPDGTVRLVINPHAVAQAAEEERTHAEGDYDARKADGLPAFPVDAHYVGTEDVLALCRAASRVFPVVVHGDATPEEGPFARLAEADESKVRHLGGDDQRGLAQELTTRRAQKSHDSTLEPLVARVSAWRDHGLRAVLSTRTQAQADRLITLLRGYGVPLNGPPVHPTAEFWSKRSAATKGAEVLVAPLSAGFVLASQGIAVVTDEEIFGARTRTTAQRKRTSKLVRGGGLEDLRDLVVGDYIVHVDHGIGRYMGIERKVLGVSAFERMQGIEPPSIELLVVEYAGKDRLFLPLTRLNQIQKYASQETHTPKLDRLGGQTFAKTKAKVREHVQKLADDLLRLYAERKALTRPAVPAAGRDFMEFEATFPFEETPDQAKAIDDVLSDLEHSYPMDRLVCGDVGFGKTEVAIRAAFRVAVSGRQVALLCPTTVLAQQHYLNLRDRFADYPLRVEVLSRFVDRKKQSEILAGLKAGTVDIVVGTHRLLSKDVHFKELGLLVVDEEQRFGVAHKERIKTLRAQVDVLTLSATPIPRTLQMAIGGLRDLSLITTPPVDRRAVRTIIARWDDHLIEEAIRREMGRGGQTFYVYNRIEGLYERGARLQEILPNARIAVAHGQMKEGELERVMIDFVEGQFDVLCSTAIIESGLDIPRANTILIDRADMFGLSQLYQIRGRVGRSRERAYCYLLTPPPNLMSDEARYRVEALQRFTELGSGFHIASLDMELRGAGDILGAEQSGNLALVGFDMFMEMLHDAVAQLRGEPVIHDVDPELTFDVETYLPDDYIDDVGVRLSLYKRLASAATEDEVVAIAEELEDRFGPVPEPARRLVRAMTLKPVLRRFRVLGVEATSDRVTLHLKTDTPLDPAKVMALVAEPGGTWKLSPDMKLSHRFERGAPGDSIDRVGTVLGELEPLQRKAPEPTAPRT